MNISIDKSSLMLETSGNVELYSTTGSTESLLRQTMFEGVTGFNEKYIKPLLELMASKHPFFKCIEVKGDLDKTGKSKVVTFFDIVNIRQSAFLFSTLKTLGINLNVLRLGYVEESNTMYISNRILRVLMGIDEDSRNQLSLFLFCIAKFFYAICKSNVDINSKSTPSGNVAVIDSAKLTEIYSLYKSLDEHISINCEQILDDVMFDSVAYIVTPTTKPAESSMKTSTMCKYSYNAITDDKSTSVVIINETYKPNVVYRLVGNTIYTNTDLLMFNTFDFGEYIPTLICNMLKIDKVDSYKYEVIHLPIDKILTSTSKEITIGAEVLDSRLYSLLEMYPEIVENYNMKLYDGYFTTSKITSSGTVASLKEQYETDEYAQKLFEQVLPYYETFDLKDLTGIVKGFAKGEVFSMLFEGDAGTGKSTAARVIPSRCDMPFVAFNCSTNIEEADMFGTMIPNPEKKSAEDPEFIWKDGPATKAIRNGYVLIIEEINFARPGILGKLNSLLDESRQMDLPNGEVIKAHPNFRIIATCNIAYEGTNRLNKALIDRFEICKKFEDLDQKEATAIIKSRTGYADDTKISSIFNVYHAVKKYSNEQNLGLIVSIRCLLNIFKMGKYYKNARDALNSLMLNQAFLEEPEHLKYFKDTVLSAYDLTFKI